MKREREARPLSQLHARPSPAQSSRDPGTILAFERGARLRRSSVRNPLVKFNLCPLNGDWYAKKSAYDEVEWGPRNCAFHPVEALRSAIT